MKKNIAFVLLFFYCGFASPQTSRCTDDMVLSQKSKWTNPEKNQLSSNDYAPKSMHPEFIKRIDAIQNLMLETYPEGVGTKPWYNRSVWLNAPFAKNQLFSFMYSSGYPFYYCSQSFSSNPDAKEEKLKFMAIEYNTLLKVYANELPEALLQGGYEDFLINGHKVHPMGAMVGKWKGLNVYRHHGDNQYEMVVVIGRDGKELPFHYATRKEYIAYMISMYTKMKEEGLKRADLFAPPLLTPEQEEEKKKKGLADIEKNIINLPWREKAKKEYLANYKNSQQLRDEYYHDLKTTYDPEIKKYNDEIKSTADSLLNSPAVVGGLTEKQVTGSGSDIFGTEKDGGSTLVSENPKYINKNLPRYVPQYFVMYWQWWGLNAETTVRRFAAPEYFAKMINEKFPVEKLQALIDK